MLIFFSVYSFPGITSLVHCIVLFKIFYTHAFKFSPSFLLEKVRQIQEKLEEFIQALNKEK